MGTKPGDALLKLRTRSCSFKGLNDFSSENLKWEKNRLDFLNKTEEVNEGQNEEHYLVCVCVFLVCILVKDSICKGIDKCK